MELSRLTHRSSRPRVLALGSLRDPLGLPQDDLLDAMRPLVDIRTIGAGAPLWRAPRMLARTLAAVRREQFEMVHLLDPRLAPVGALVRRLTGVPISVSLTSVDTESKSPLTAFAMRQYRARVPYWV